MNNDLLDLFLQDVNLPLDQGEEDGDLDFFGDEEQGNDFVQEDQQDVDDHDHDQNQDEQDDQDDQDDQDIILIFITAFLTLYQAARRLDNIRRPNPAIPFIRFNIDAYDDVMCERLFRFRADEIRDVAVALRMPDIFHLDNGSKVYSLEGLCIVLRRFAYPCRFVELVQMFGRSESMLSRITSRVLHWIYRRWAPVLFRWDHTRLTPAKLEQFAAAIQADGAPLPRVIGFIDGTVRPIARPSEGQEQDYNGHHRVHAMKYQAVASPDGLIIHLSGPYQGRHHDTAMYRASGLENTLMEHALDNNGNQMYVYGDPGYQLSPVLQVPFSTVNITPPQRAYNEAMSRVRVGVEWSFGHVLQSFAFSDYKKNQRSLLSAVHLHYIVSVLFTNLLSCITQNNASVGRFGVLPPTLEEYLHG